MENLWVNRLICLRDRCLACWTWHITIYTVEEFDDFTVVYHGILYMSFSVCFLWMKVSCFQRSCHLVLHLRTSKPKVQETSDFLKRLENHQKTRKTQQKWKNGENTKVKTPKGWKRISAGKQMETTWFQKGENTNPPISKDTSNTSRPMASSVKARARPPTEKWSLHTSGAPRFFSGAGASFCENRFPQLEGWPIFGWAVFFWNIFMESQEIICVWNPSNALPFRISSHCHPSQLGMPSLKGGRWSWNARWGVEFCE